MRKFEVYNRKNRLEVKMAELQCDGRNRMSGIVKSVDKDVYIEISVHALGLCMALAFDIHVHCA